ncbi:MAG: hypothetical protein BMS9Abin26_1562 [Gammaproteobacteria bacterium]|nr:MAG: hypothetical protein BMS9Abin26_1562 [Gammaproteobacteria bacterium]
MYKQVFLAFYLLYSTSAFASICLVDLPVGRFAGSDQTKFLTYSKQS